MNKMETKKYSKCGIIKPLNEFHKNGFNRQGKQKYRGYCKDCTNKRETEQYWEKRNFIDAQRIECIKCGDTRLYVLDFHHIDPSKQASKKDFTTGQIKKVQKKSFNRK